MSVLSHTDGKRILVKFDYSRDLVAKIKTVPGARPHYIDNKFDAWRLPLTMDTCRSLRKVFGNDLLVSEALADWARGQLITQQTLENFREGNGTVLLPRVESEAPELFAAMSTRHYQLAGTAFIRKAGQVILADDPGLGKTLQTLGALIEADARTILVACRRTATRTVWERETARWAPSIQTFVAQGSPVERERAMANFEFGFNQLVNKPRMLIINIEMVRAKRIVICPQGLGDDCPAYKVGQCNHKYEAEYTWPFLFRQNWDAIVFDESHNLLASTKNVQSKGITQARYGAMSLRKQLKPNGLAIALSGTPFRSKLTKGWGTLNWCRPDVFGSFWRWAETHFGVEQGTWGKEIAGGAKVPEPKNQAAWDAMLRPYYLRREKADAAPDLPPIFYAGTPVTEDPDSPCYVQLDMEPRQAKAYRQMAEDAEAVIEGGRIMAVGVLAELTRQRQLACAYGRLGRTRSEMEPTLPSNKMDWLVEFMQEREGTDKKVVVASSFTELVELAAKVLRNEGFEVLTLTGATSDQARADLVARFQDPNDKLQVVVINRKAGGESITLDAADEMVILDPPWISDDDEQLQARIHRVSRIHQVTVYRLISVGTVESWIAGLTDGQRLALAGANPQKLSDLVKEATL